MKDIELKPCPFCGMQLENNPPSSIWFHPQNGCLLSMRGFAEKDQLTAWNTRKPIERILERLKEKSAFNELWGEASLTTEEALDIIKKEGL